MNIYAYTNDGFVYQVFYGGQLAPSAVNQVESEWSDNPEDLYFDGELKRKPPQPSPHHTFDYALKQWIDPRTSVTQWAVVRNERARLLQESDWTQLPDVPLATKQAWATYRQALRDVTNQADPFNLVWPQQPE